MTKLVLVADKVDAPGLLMLEQGPGLEVVKAIKNPAKLKETLPRAQALLVRSETKVTAEMLAQAPNLRVIGRAGIGVDNIDVEEATRRGIAVFNAPGGNTVSAAEHTIGLLLALERKITWADASMRRGEWDRKRFEGTELRGKTIGVVGLGRIGAHVAQLARVFGMTVVAHDPFVPAERATEVGVKLLPLEQLLRTADVVSLHLALTEQTACLINADRLRLMKPGALLINTARGELVDEAARLRGVALVVRALVERKHVPLRPIELRLIESELPDAPRLGFEQADAVGQRAFLHARAQRKGVHLARQAAAARAHRHTAGCPEEADRIGAEDLRSPAQRGGQGLDRDLQALHFDVVADRGDDVLQPRASRR